MNIALVDDMPQDLKGFVAVLQDYAAINQLPLEVTTFTSAEAFLADYQPLKYTVIFLDIYMDGITGIQAAEQIRRRDQDTILVFLTTSDEHRAEAFQYHAYDYVRKPVDAGQLFRVMDDILRRHTEWMEQRFSFSSNRREYSLPHGDIMYVQSAGHMVEVVDRNGRSYSARSTFAQVCEQLEGDKRFLLILRGILVNMDYITGITRDSCFLQGERRLPLNVKKRKTIEQLWHNYKFAKIRSAALRKEAFQ